MTVLTVPSITASSAKFSLVSNTKAHVSPLSKTTQTIEYPGARWALTLVYNNLSYADTRTMKAFLAKCRGQGGRFYYGDPAFLSNGPAGVATGTPLVNGASQTGSTIDTDGWTASQTGILKAGDYFHFTNGSSGREMHMVVDDANSNGAGEATLTIEPPIRVSPADNAAITVTNAMCQFRLEKDEVEWSTRPPLISNITITAIETFTDAA